MGVRKIGDKDNDKAAGGQQGREKGTVVDGMTAGIPETTEVRDVLELELATSDNGLVCRNVDTIIALGATLFLAVYQEEAGWQPKISATYHGIAMRVAIYQKISY